MDFPLFWPRRFAPFHLNGANTRESGRLKKTLSGCYDRLMKKKTLWIAGIALVLAAAYIGTDLVLGSIVKAAVNRLGPPLVQTKLELAGASLSPLSGSGTLYGLYVGNPKGWSSDKAFYLEKIHVSLVPSSIFSDHIVIKEIVIDGPEFVYETQFVRSNVGDLLKNMQKSASSDSGAPQPTAKNGRPLTFEVRRFRLINGRVTLGVGPAALTLPMPPITLDNLGSGGSGITSAELAVVVMRTLVTGVVDATTHAAGKVGSALGGAAGDAAKGAGDALKDLFGGKK